MPKTSKNRPTAESTTPNQSKLCFFCSNTGTLRHARNKPARPTGMLMKKIQPQPQGIHQHAAQNRPTSEATPAVAPPNAHGNTAPFGGNISVIRHGLRGHQRRTQALHHAGGNQRLNIRRQTTHHRRQTQKYPYQSYRFF